MGKKLILIAILLGIIFGYFMGFGELVGATVIVGIIVWAVWKLLYIIFDDDHAPYE